MNAMRDHRDPRDWARPWRDPPGLICCCTTTTTSMVVVSFLRYNVGAFGNATNVSLDPTGATNWYYDLGTVTQTFSGGTRAVALKPGQPIIDSSGNVYIPSTAATDITVNPNIATAYLDKVNKTGTQVWRYTSITGSVIAGTSAPTPPGCCFDSSGNIVFCHARDSVSNKCIAKVDTTGALVTDYVVVSGTNGFPGGVTPISGDLITGIALDSTDHIYWITAGTASVPNKQIFKMDSSGNFVARMTLSGLSATGQCYSLFCDKGNGKLFCGNTAPTSAISTSTLFAQRVDCSAMTEDWAATVNLWNAFNLKFTSPTIFNTEAGAVFGGGICFNSANLTVFQAGSSLSTSDNPNVILEQLMAITNAGAKDWGAVYNSNITGNISHGTDCCFDPLNNNVYVINSPPFTGTAPKGQRVNCYDSNGNLQWSALPYGATTDGESMRIGCGEYS